MGEQVAKGDSLLPRWAGVSQGYRDTWGPQATSPRHPPPHSVGQLPLGCCPGGACPCWVTWAELYREEWPAQTRGQQGTKETERFLFYFFQTLNVSKLPLQSLPLQLILSDILLRKNIQLVMPHFAITKSTNLSASAPIPSSLPLLL